MKNISSNLRGKLKQNHVLAEHTSWKIGGPAEYFYEPANLEDLKLFLQGWKEKSITVFGAATNVLIRDGGIKGLVIYLRSCLNELSELDGFTLRVEAGVGLSSLVQKCVHLGMIDAVFLAGIPGTVGGALAMNAGAYGDYIWNHVVAVETVNRSGEIKLRQAQEFTAGYRQVAGLAKDEWFVAAQLNFARGDRQEMERQIREQLQKRKNSQPLDFPSCGSVFRNPQGDYAARLIEACGLKGKQIGGARVSEKHANFIVNCGGATAADVEALMQEIMVAVKKDHNIDLIAEVRILGE
ncbi:MAG: UDP-N-acetylenolpyruvoylglucosamine reductase [uncultured bacterium]|nr:MAG: UDP-N-acetylenolpyruvoylglucosamine reductase [uncultured bacterium]